MAIKKENKTKSRQRRRPLPAMLVQMGFNRENLKQFIEMLGGLTSQAPRSTEFGGTEQIASGKL